MYVENFKNLILKKLEETTYKDIFAGAKYSQHLVQGYQELHLLELTTKKEINNEN